MKLLAKGKTKNVYALPDGNILLEFKDDATGTDGVFDPGANTVGLTVPGMGQCGLRLSQYFFGKISEAGFPTHFVGADIDAATMTVRPAKVFGHGLEVVCRLRATGSFMRRYGAYAEEGQPLPALIEFTLKDNDREDPPITPDALDALGILRDPEYTQIRTLTREITALIEKTLAQRGMELYDIKLEFGLVDGRVALIDEISGGNMRVYKDGAIVSPMALADLVL